MNKQCWTCGTPMDPARWAEAPREPSNDALRVCVDCHVAVESAPDPRRVANMVRYVAGLPAA